MSNSSGAILAKVASALVFPWKTIKRSWRNGITLLIWMMASCQAQLPPRSSLVGEVEQVVSAQTVDVNFPTESRSLRLRLWGVDTPERLQDPWGRNAQTFLRTQLQGKTVRVQLLASTPDRFGRFSGLIWVNQNLVNERLVAEGYGLVNLQNQSALAASIDHTYPQRLLWAQQRARLLGLGIWDPRLPLRQTPQEFRQLQPLP